MNLTWKIGIVEYEFGKVIDDLIIEESREEAKNIMFHAIVAANSSDKKLSEYFTTVLTELAIYVERDMGNIICLHISSIKSKLHEMTCIRIKGHDFDKHF